LGHESDESALRGQTGKIRHDYFGSADESSQLAGFLVRPFQEFGKQSEFVQHLHRGRVNGITAKIAEKVGVLLENQNLNAGPGEQESEHDAGGPATGDTAANVLLLHGI
jgi:hypothetical protein